MGTARAGASGSHRDDIVEAVAFTAERLLLSTEWRDAADEVLARLGQAAGVSRAYIAANVEDGDGRLTSTRLAEWTGPGIVRVMDDPDFRSDLPETDRPLLERPGVVSPAKFPVFAGGECWGAIGFDCTGVREWTSDELAALRASATVLGAAIQRQRLHGQAFEAETRYRQLVEHLPAVMYLDVLDDDEVRVDYIGPQVEDLLGYPAERFIRDPDFWSSIVYPEDRARVEGSGTLTFKRGVRFEQEYRMIAADGHVVRVRDVSTEIAGGPSTPHSWQGFLVDVTSRRRTEERLVESEERYRALVDHSPDAILVHADGRFVFANQAAADLLAAETPATLVGLPIDTIVHPDDRDLVDDRVALEQLGQVVPLLEERFIRLDGREILVEVAGIPVRYEGRNAGQIVVRDISRRKEAEEHLRSAEERYRALVEHIPAVVYVETPEGDPDRFYISPQVEAVFGYPAEEWRLTTDFWIDHVHPDDRPQVVSDDERTNVDRAHFSLDYRFLAADGEWRWIHDEATFLEEPDGGGFWQGFMLDITERKRVEERLRDAELKFRTIVEQNEAIFYTQELDPDDPTISLTTYVAPGNTDLIGYSIEDIEQDPTLWRRIIHPDDRERVLAVDAKSNTGGGDRFSLEYRIVRKDGRVIWVQDRAALVRLHGKPPYWQGFLLDVTERKVAEEQLARALDTEREAARRLRALDEMKNTFLNAVSHDLRTPLAAILGLAITLERGDVKLEATDAQDLAGRIAENARKLDRLVTNLLDMDRLARGIVSPKLESVDVGEVVRRLVIESDLIERSRLTMDVEPVVIPVDASKIERIVENLLANTARHTPSNAHVWVSVRRHEEGALIKVEDSGVGVPAELREAIFEPFQQGPDAPEHSPGVGVGLTLVRRFAELHGGRAWIEERAGGGASFQVFLPGSPPLQVTA
ncbi:MAG: PAS domain S-box protein [Actinomycetota bacterium]